MNDRTLDSAMLSFLDGTLDEEGTERLAARMHDDADAQQRFAQLLRRDLLLREQVSRVAEEPPQRRPLPIRRHRTSIAPAWWRRRHWQLTAAAVLLVAMTAGIMWWPEREPQAILVLDGMTQPARVGEPIIAGKAGLILGWRGEDTRCSVAHGSEVMLGTGPSKLLIVRHGTVTAEVTPQPAGHPLIMRSDRAQVEVIGTRFSFTVQAGTGTVTRSCLEVEKGMVRFSDPTGQVLVRSGERATSDAGGLWLHQDIEVSAPYVPQQAGAWPNLHFDVPLPSGTNLFVDKVPTTIPTRIRTANRSPSVLLAGGPWPTSWMVQQWRQGSQGEAEIAAHPDDGRTCLMLRNTGGLPSIQAITQPMEIPANAEVKIAWRYRCTGSAQPRMYYVVDEKHSIVHPLPSTQLDWRTVAVPVPAADRKRRLQLMFQNYGHTAADVLALCDVRVITRENL